MKVGGVGRGALRVALRAAGAFLVAVPFLPIRRLFGRQWGTSFLLEPAEWLLGLFVFLGVAWLLSLTPLGPRVGEMRRRAAALAEGRPFPAAALALLLGLLALVAAFVFRGRPLLVDGVAQLFQARIFASGAAFAPAPPDEAFFVVWQLIVDGGRWFAQYPPGHGLALSAGVLAGAPWIVPMALSLGTAWFLYRFACRAYGEGTGRLTLALALLCPFFWFMGASYMNHVSALFFVSLGLLLVARWEEAGGRWNLVGAGMTLGGVLLSRPLTAVAVGAVLAPAVVAKAWRRRELAAVALAGAGFAAVAALYPAFNALTTGDPLLPGYILLWGEGHGLGFHLTPWGDVHTPLMGLRNQLTDLSLLNLYLFEWPIPALLPVGFFFLLGLDARGWDRRLLAAFLAIPVAYFFYWHRDDYLGPRFLYEGMAFLLPLTARAIQVSLRRLAPARPTGRSRLLPPDGAAIPTLLLLLCFGYAVAYGTPQRFRIYATGMASMKVDLTARAAEAGIREGLVFVSVSWGNRLLAALRGAGLPASLAERAYRALDHCDLELLHRRGLREGWDAARLTREVEGLLEAPPARLVTPDLNGDPTLRLRPDRPLAEECREELRYDQAGFTVYEPHLLANTPRLDGPLVVARDLRERNGELRRRYPGRPAYLWRGGSTFEPLP